MKKILYITLFLMLPALTYAQVSKHVEVTKDYKPTVSTAQKLSIIPDMTDTVKMRPDIDYSVTPRSYETSLMTQNFKPATITYWDYNRARPLYVRAGVGVPLQSEADVYISTFNKDRGYAMAYVNHWGDYSDRICVKGLDIEENTTEMSNRIGGRAGLFVGSHLLEVDIVGDMQHRHRYPTTGEYIDFGRMGAKLRFGDDFTDLSRWNFNVEFGGGLFLDDRNEANFNQSNILAKFALGKMLGKNILRIHVNYDGAYGAKTMERYKNHTIMAGARYGLSSDRFDFLIGADYYYDDVAGITASPHHIFPYLRMTWKNTTAGFVPFVEIDGGVKRNDYESLIYTNPFLANDGYALSQMANEGVYNGRVGISGTLGKGVFSYNLSAELSFADDHVYWYTDSAANYYYTQAYQHTLRIDGGVMLRPAGCFEAELKAGIYAWENYDNYYSNRPNFDASLDLRYIGRKFSVGATAAYQGGIKWMTETVVEDVAPAQGAPVEKTFGYVKTDGTFSLGVEAEYSINDRWAIYAEGRNLTGSIIYEWLNYYQDSAEGIIGVKMSF